MYVCMYIYIYTYKKQILTWVWARTQGLPPGRHGGWWPPPGGAERRAHVRILFVSIYSEALNKSSRLEFARGSGVQT